MAHHKLVVLQVPCQLNCTKRPFAQTFLHFIPFASSDKGRLLQLRHSIDKCASWASLQLLGAWTLSDHLIYIADERGRFA